METLELMEMDFSSFEKYKSHRNSKDGGKISTLSVQKV